MNITIVVLSDPTADSEEAVGRVFNALAAAYDFRQRGMGVHVLFQGAGTRWPSLLRDPEHPVHGLFGEVEDLVTGVSSGCADVFGAAASAADAGFDLINDNPVPGTSGLPSLAQAVAEGRKILIF